MSIGRNTVSSTAEAVIIQYHNGKSLYRQSLGVGRFAPLVGFTAEAGRDEELDALMRELSIPRIEIKHPRPGAAAAIVQHWLLGEQIRLYVITSGPVAPTAAQSLAGPNAGATAAAGIGLRWGNGERSKLAVRGYLDLLGAEPLVQLSVRSRMSDALLAAMIDHVRVCEAADGLIDRTRHPDLVTLHEVALPLGPGEETEWGKEETSTVTPLVSQHPAELDASYLRGVWRPDSIHAAALRAWGGVQHWARAYAVGDVPNEAPASVQYEDDEAPRY